MIVIQRNYGQVAQLVERSPEKAGVGGSIPSLATSFSITYRPSKRQFHSNSFQLNGAEGFVSSEMPTRIAGGWLSISPVSLTTQITPGRLSKWRNVRSVNPQKSKHHNPSSLDVWVSALN
jgi:hypothetical protein